MAIQQLLQSKQGGIPPQMMALLELEQAKQALMQSGVAPGTVAGQKVQEAQMLTQPPQQPGMQDLMPGVQQRAGEMAQAQQPVTQAQLQQAMAQQAQQSQQPVMAAEGGIITLPADIEMAEGGIVGYNGETGSAVKLLNPEFDEEGLPRGKDERERIIDYNNKVRAAYEQQMKAKATTSPRTAAPSMQNIADVMAGRRQLEQFYRPRDPEAYTPEMVGFRVGNTTPVDTSVPLRMQDTRGGTPEMAALAQMLGSGAAPSPAPSSRPPAAPAAAPAASGVASPLQQYQTAGEAAIQRALAPLLEAKKERKLTPEEEAFVKRQEENLLRSRERLTEQERRFLDLERQREEAGKTTGLQDLAAFLSRVGGARSLFAGLNQASRTQTEIDAARRKEAQAAIDRKRQYFDLLEDRKDAIEQRDLAIQQGRMDRARAEQDRIDAVNRALAQTTGTLEAQRMQGLASLMGHQITAEEAAKNRAQSSRQADEAKMLALLGRLDQTKLEELRKIEADHSKDPKYKMIYTMEAAARATGGKLTPEQESQVRAADAVLEAKKAEVFKSFGPRISQVEKRVFGTSGDALDLSKWKNFSVKQGE